MFVVFTGSIKCVQTDNGQCLSAISAHDQPGLYSMGLDSSCIFLLVLFPSFGITIGLGPITDRLGFH